MGHLWVAGVVGREKKPAPSELSGRYGVWTTGGDDFIAENLGSTAGVSSRVLIVLHSPLCGSMGEPEWSGSNMMGVS